MYADSVAVLGPLSSAAEPHSYDMCQVHGDRLTAPRGWEVVRIEPDLDGIQPSRDDLEALANAVREAALEDPGSPTLFDEDDRLPGAVGAEGIRRGHLWALPGRSSRDIEG